MRTLYILFSMLIFGLCSCEPTLGELWEKNQTKSEELKNQILSLCKTNIRDSIKNTKQDINLRFFDEFNLKNGYNTSNVMLELLEATDSLVLKHNSDDSLYTPSLFQSVLMDYFSFTGKNSELKGRKQKTGKAYDLVFEAIDKIRYINAVRVVFHNRNTGICVTDNYLCDVKENKLILVFRLTTTVNPDQRDVVLPIDANIKVKEHRSVGGHSTTLEEKDIHVTRNEIINSYEQSLTKAYFEQRNAYLKKFVLLP